MVYFIVAAAFRGNDTMTDTLTTLRNSTIQHGPLNNRIFLLKLAPGDCPDILLQLNELAERMHYTKLIAKIPSELQDAFIKDGYRQEAVIPAFFNAGDRHGTPVAIMAKYTVPERRIDPELKRAEAILAEARKKKHVATMPPPAPPFTCRPADKSDIAQMAALYTAVFPTYPFPVHDPDYLARTMEEACHYLGIWQGDELVSLASAEMDRKEKNAEMTDFATLPRYRGRRFAGMLLHALEAAIRPKGIKTCYTIARALSPGMNITFARAGYHYSGTLINNTNISGRIESMNIWYKSL